MKKIQKIELLAPAKNAEIGIEAINHGADAVYIGAPQFSARSAAGNSIEDIKTLINHAHIFHAKVYVALNTILKDSELEAAQLIIHQCYEAGADAIIVQDMGILNLDLPPIPLHASTQTNNQSIEKVKFLEDAGFSQVVLARELSINEIKDIASNTNVPLEVFVHGALCTSYSGKCYISQALSGRSANRGECAQYCRMPYSLQDASGRLLATEKHLLSLKDLNQSENLEELLDAGVQSLKIEGRLKDMSYVKNITAFYRQKLDDIFERRPEYQASSSGKSIAHFVPNPAKSFNRGFTSYFLHKRDTNIASPDTPKSLGEPVGNILDLNNNSFTIKGLKTIHNGDGLCFINDRKELQGFRVNRVEKNRVFPADMPRLSSGITLYRNYDHEFEKLLTKKSAERKIGLELILEENNFGFTLTAIDEDFLSTSTCVVFKKELSLKNQKENMLTQLSKLGNTPFLLHKFTYLLSDNWFIPSSLLGEMRRKIIENLLSVRKIATPTYRKKIQPTSHPYPEKTLSYLGNVYNAQAKAFYQRHNVQSISPAFESEEPEQTISPSLMFMKYCLKYQLGYCGKNQEKKILLREPLTLLCGKHQLELKFDCRECRSELKIKH